MTDDLRAPRTEAGGALLGELLADTDMDAQCPATYPQHPHVWRRGNERSISDAPRCQGVPNDAPTDD